MLSRQFNYLSKKAILNSKRLLSNVNKSNANSDNRLRLVTFENQGFPVQLGLLKNDNTIVNLNHNSILNDNNYEKLRGLTQDMNFLISFGSDIMPLLRKLLADHSIDSIISRDSVKLLSPIPLPKRNILCIGKNYLDHITEIANATPNINSSIISVAPQDPIFFTKAPQCVVPPEGIIESHADLTKWLDYEAELAVIIGKSGRDISEENAMSHVFGYSIANDVTARDLQKKHGQWFKGKSLDSSCPFGPCIVPVCCLDPSDLEISLKLNGLRTQHSRTSKMILTIPKIVQQLSRGFTLHPGDIILTGTPEGVGYASKPPRALKPGDEIVIEIEHIGTLRNRVL